MDENFGQAYLDDCEDWRTRYENAIEDNEMDKLARGTQVIYKPNHAVDLNDPACEMGFVTSGPTNDGSYFVRYFLKGQYKDILRTVSCSVRTPGENLFVQSHHDQNYIDELLKKFC